MKLVSCMKRLSGQQSSTLMVAVDWQDISVL